jgi:hypothetical protein
VSGRPEAGELEYGMDATNSSAAHGAGGTERESVGDDVVCADGSLAGGEAVVERRRPQRPSPAPSLEERVRTETSQFDFTTLVALGGDYGDSGNGNGASSAGRAAPIPWPARTVQHSDPESLDERVPEAFAPPAEPTIRLVVKSTPTAAERRRAALRTWVVAAGAFVLGAGIWGLVPRGAGPAPVNRPAESPARSNVVIDSARVPMAAPTERIPAAPPVREAVGPAAPAVSTAPPRVARAAPQAARPRRPRVVRARPSARRARSTGARNSSGFSNHVNAVLNQLP